MSFHCQAVDHCLPVALRTPRTGLLINTAIFPSACVDRQVCEQLKEEPRFVALESAEMKEKLFSEYVDRLLREDKERERVRREEEVRSVSPMPHIATDD